MTSPPGELISKIIAFTDLSFLAARILFLAPTADAASIPPLKTEPVNSLEIAPESLYEMTEEEVAQTAQENYEIIEQKDAEIKSNEEQEKKEAMEAAEKAAQKEVIKKGITPIAPTIMDQTKETLKK